MGEYKEVYLPFDFTPRDYQIPMMTARQRGYKREVYVLHRRAGKDLTAWNDTIIATQEKVGFYPYFFPTFAQAKKVIWDGMTKEGRRFLDYIPRGIIADGTKGTKKINSTEMKIEFKNGSLLQLIGTDNFEALKGTNCIGAVFSEYALQDPRAWEKVVEPILLENGGWAKFLYTPNGKNHGYYLWEYAKHHPEEWESILLTIDETRKEDGTPVMTLEQIDALRERGVDEELIQQEYYCSFTMGTAGAYYAKLMEKARQDGRIKKVLLDTATAVHTFWDIGVSDFTSIIFAQILPGEYHIIDFYENHSEGVQHYIKVLQEKGYTYGNHYGPHDLKARIFALDGKPTIQIAKEYGINFQIVPRLSFQDGIEATRNLINKTYFDEEKSKILIKHLDNYSKNWNNTMKVWTKEPRRDEHCLAGGTKIRTLNGYKAIENIKMGDYVWGYSIKEHRLIPTRVEKQLFDGVSSKILKIEFNNHKFIECTEEHPFMLRNEEYRKAKDLKIGDSLMPMYEYTDGRGYQMITLNDGSKAREHSFVYTRFNGLLRDKYVIHHSNYDKNNNNPDNLIQLSISDHTKLHANDESRIGIMVKATKASHKKIRHKCLECGKEFFAQKGAMYCSKLCKDRFCRRRRKNNHKITKITKIFRGTDVYDLYVPETGNFVAESVVVHNTHAADAMRYMAVSQKTSVVYDPRAQALTNEIDYEYLRRKCDKYSGLS